MDTHRICSVETWLTCWPFCSLELLRIFEANKPFRLGSICFPLILFEYWAKGTENEKEFGGVFSFAINRITEVRARIDLQMGRNWRRYNRSILVMPKFGG